MNEQEHNQPGEHPKSKDLNRYAREQLRKETGHEDREEYAAELAVPYAEPLQAPIEHRRPVQLSAAEEGRTRTQGRGVGYTALVMGLLSLFIFPSLLGSVAALLGVITFFQGNRALGVWSVTLGLISLVGYFLLVPLYA
jgi:hypothetical protein